MKLTQRRLFWAVLVALLLMAAVRILRMGDLSMHIDEEWHVWQTFGTLQQINAWSPFDWPPLYEFMLAGWELLVGIHPVAVRALSLLLSFIGAAFAFRAGRFLGGKWAGLFSLLIYGGLTFFAWLSGYVRPYALALPLLLIGFYVTLRYMDPRPRRKPVSPSWRRFIGTDLYWGCLLTLIFGISFYTALISALWISFFGIFTLVAYPFRRTIRRWIPIAVALVVLAIPIVLNWRWVLSNNHLELPRLPFFTTLNTTWLAFTGDAHWIWLLLAILGFVGWLVYSRRQPRLVIGFAIWIIGGVLLLYVIQPYTGLFEYHYMFWILAAMTLLGAVLLAQLPNRGKIAAALALTALVFIPVPDSVQLDSGHPGLTNFYWLKDHYRDGDAVVLDPGFDCMTAYEFDYLTRALFPQGMDIVHTIPANRRVWYAANVNTQDLTFAAKLEANRVPSIFVGPPTCLFRLYEGPPDVAGISFANGMNFHGGLVIRHAQDQDVPAIAAAHEGETIPIQLWWSADSVPALDYSVGVYLFDTHGQLVAQSDGAPRVEPAETSRWQIGKYYIEERDITVPYPSDSGDYRVALAVYEWWGDHQRIKAPGLDSDNLLTLFDISVKSF